MRFLILPLLLITLIIGTAAQAEEVAEGPAVPIDALSATLTEIAAAGATLSFAERSERLEPAVLGSYNLPLMTRLVVGSSAWSGLSEQDQEQLTNAFQRMSIAAYAARFGGEPGGQDLQFSVSDVEDGARGTKIVSNFLQLDQQDNVKFSYVMRRGEAGWRIVDVVIDDQYSELSRRRADFGAVLRAGGVSALLERIDEIVVNYQSDS